MREANSIYMLDRPFSHHSMKIEGSKSVTSVVIKGFSCSLPRKSETRPVRVRSLLEVNCSCSANPAANQESAEL